MDDLHLKWHVQFEHPSSHIPDSQPSGVSQVQTGQQRQDFQLLADFNTQPPQLLHTEIDCEQERQDIQQISDSDTHPTQLPHAQTDIRQERRER